MTVALSATHVFFIILLLLFLTSFWFSLVMEVSLWEFYFTSTWLSWSQDNSGLRIYVLLISSLFSFDPDDQNPGCLSEECK